METPFICQRSFVGVYTNPVYDSSASSLTWTLERKDEHVAIDKIWFIAETLEDLSQWFNRISEVTISSGCSCTSLSGAVWGSVLNLTKDIVSLTDKGKDKFYVPWPGSICIQDFPCLIKIVYRNYQADQDRSGLYLRWSPPRPEGRLVGPMFSQSFSSPVLTFDQPEWHVTVPLPSNWPCQNLSKVIWIFDHSMAVITSGRIGLQNLVTQQIQWVYEFTDPFHIGFVEKVAQDDVCSKKLTYTATWKPALTWTLPNADLMVVFEFHNTHDKSRETRPQETRMHVYFQGLH